MTHKDQSERRKAMRRAYLAEKDAHPLDSKRANVLRVAAAFDVSEDLVYRALRKRKAAV